MTASDRSNLLIAAGLLIVLTPIAVGPIYSYDFFWHLATGRWIFDHHALPLTDPFAVAGDGAPWINGEWLFQLPLYIVHLAGGIALVAWTRALVVAAIFSASFFVAARVSRQMPTALLLTSLAFAGGYDRLDARPGTIAALLLVCAIATLEWRSRRSSLAYAIVTMLWINIHPSAVIAPAIAAAVALLGRERRDAWITTAVSAVALLFNPFGLSGVIAPLRLTAFASSGTFVNAEWLPSPVRLFPLLYVCVALGVIFFATTGEERRDQFWRAAVFAFLAYLSIAHVRNQGLFFAAFAILAAPMARREVSHRGLIIAAIVPVAWIGLRASHIPGLTPHRFPVDAVNRLRQTGLAGNIYNPDQFGGYLIWSFYPQRRALTDGRNELYHTYIAEYARARTDSRAWHALLRKYRVDLAVDEYRGAIDTIDGRTGEHRPLPASLAYFPRRDWALIAYDDVSMVFARRAAFQPDAISRWELKGAVPDAQPAR